MIFLNNQLKLTKKTKIVYFAEIFPSKSETWVHNEIKELVNLGCTVQVYATHPKPELIPDEHHPLYAMTQFLDKCKFNLNSIYRVLKNKAFIYQVSKGLLFDCNSWRHRAQVSRDILYIMRFLPELDAFNPDIVVSHFAGTRTNLALFYHFLSETPFIFKMHAADVFNRTALFTLKVNRASSCLTISNYNIRYIKNNYPDINYQSFEKHCCGINLDEFDFLVKTKHQATAHILAVGRLVPMKGFKYLIEASHLLFKKGVNFQVIIIGDGPEKTSLEQLISAYELHDVVKLAGYHPPSTILKTLFESDLFVLPCVWDTFAKTQDGIPVALMEAMAVGVPVVSTFTSGIPELINDEVNGFLATPNNAKSLSDKLEKCLSLDEKSRNQMLYNARETIIKKHNIKTLTQELMKKHFV